MTYLLHSFGYVALTARDGPAGLEQRRSPRPTSVIAEPLPPMNCAVKHGSVLVVDDVAANRTFLRSLLEPFGYSTRTCRGSRQALALAREQPSDLIVTDVHLGRESGLELLRSIKTDPILRSIPVALISATSPKKALTPAPDGAVAVLRWGRDPSQLLAQIEGCLRVAYGGTSA